MRGRTEILNSIFRSGETGFLEHGETLIGAGELPRRVYQLRTGLAYQSCRFADGRRAVVDIFTPGNLIGIEAILSSRASGTVIAAGPVKYLALDAASIHQLMEDREIALSFSSVVLEARRRTEELSARIARLGAPERIAAMLVDLHDRLRRRRLIARTSYNLYLTQQQIGDHLGLTGAHINRVLNWLAREDIALVKGYVVIVRDMARLRRLARGEEAIETRRPKPSGDRTSKRDTRPAEGLQHRPAAKRTPARPKRLRNTGIRHMLTGRTEAG
jgi:CRP/FNR family transcriptional regulator, anaerobic regulatory protein